MISLINSLLKAHIHSFMTVGGGLEAGDDSVTLVMKMNRL